MNSDRSELNPCVCRDSEQDVAGEEHGDDFLIPGGVRMNGWAREKTVERKMLREVCKHNLIGAWAREDRNI